MYGMVSRQTKVHSLFFTIQHSRCFSFAFLDAFVQTSVISRRPGGVMIIGRTMFPLLQSQSRMKRRRGLTLLAFRDISTLPRRGGQSLWHPLLNLFSVLLICQSSTATRQLHGCFDTYCNHHHHHHHHMVYDFARMTMQSHLPKRL